MLRSRTPILLIVMTFMMAATLPAMALELGGHIRDGVVVGLDFGYGWNNVKFKDTEGAEVSTGDIETFNGGFQVGWAPNDNFFGSIGMNGWRRNYNTLAGNIDGRYYSFMLEGYFFPRGEGFWIKGGIGRGTLDLTFIPPGERYNINEKGLALTTGAGYELRVADTTAVALAYIYQHTDVGDFGGGTDTTVRSHVASLTIRFYVQ